MLWHDEAACRDADPSLFFPPEVPRGKNLAQRWSPDAAIAICITCPVRADCLDHALSRPEDHGVWGGVWFRDDGYARKQVTKKQSRYRDEVQRLGAAGRTPIEIAYELRISRRHVHRFLAEAREQVAS